MKPPDIELHINELVLHGFAPGDRHAITEAVEQELHRLFASKSAPALLPRDLEVAHLDGGAFRVQRGARAETMAVQIAQTLYRGLADTFAHERGQSQLNNGDLSGIDNPSEAKNLRFAPGNNTA